MSVADHEDAPALLGGARRGGFDSTTERHRFAAGLADHDRPTEVLDIGDHDPSGAHKFLAMMEDIQAFTRELGGEVTFTRLAVTPAQITQYGLEAAPPKATDNPNMSGRGARARCAGQHPARGNRGPHRRPCPCPRACARAQGTARSA